MKIRKLDKYHLPYVSIQIAGGNTEDGEVVRAGIGILGDLVVNIGNEDYIIDLQDIIHEVIEYHKSFNN